jgi:segregation and condensation protein A
MGAAYAVSLPGFEGPLDLLLHLIEQDKLDISAISLVAVTDQYLRTLEQLEELEPGALADFLVVASRLLYIKSLRLLPQPAAGGDEEEDSADDLVRRLLEYRQFKRAAATLRAWDDEGTRLFGRPGGAPGVEFVGKAPVFGEFEQMLLQEALRRALARTPETPPIQRVQPYAVTVADRIETVRDLLAYAARGPEPAQLPFSRLLADATSRVEIIVTFLAVLELVKQAELVAVQSDTFGEILLTPLSRGETGAPLASPDDDEADPE